MHTKTLYRCALMLAAAGSILDGVGAAAPAPAHAAAATVQDTVRLRTFAQYGGRAVALSPDGTHVAYVLKEPNLTRNVNEYVLYVRALPRPGAAVTRHNGRALFRGRSAALAARHEMGTPFQWLGDSRGLLVLHKPDGEPRAILSRVDRQTGQSRVVYRGDMDVTAFSASATGDRLALAGVVPQAAPVTLPTRGLVVDRHASGVRQVDALEQESQTVEELRLVDADGTSVTVGRLKVWTLSLSPDGRRLAFVTEAGLGGPAPPAAWQAVPKIREWGEGLRVAWLMTLPATIAASPQHTATKGVLVSWPVTPAFPAPPAGFAVTWSPDSTAYALEAWPTPQDYERPGVRPRLFAVTVARGTHAELLGPPPRRPYAHNRVTTAFDARAGRALVLYPDGQLVAVRRTAAGAWTIAQETAPGLWDRSAPDTTDANEHVVVGVAQAPMIPPDLSVLDRASGTKTVLTDLNPELRAQGLGKTERIEWADDQGTYWGHIVYPPNYVPGRRYPAAILCKGWDHSFIHGGQIYIGHYPPQALAAADILVFMLGYPRALPGRTEDDADQRDPMANLAYRSFHRARQELDRRGLIDPTRVGVMGFSSTSADVDFLISHPTPGPPWAAAVSVDGGLWNYMGTTVFGTPREVASDYAQRFGASGKERTLDEARETLLRYAPAWNASAVRAPLLMSYHGSSTWGGAEFRNALAIRGKPVELMWFPNGAHNLQLPWEREASMQQVVDWFRFWLKREERTEAAPREPRQELQDQYARWRTLRTEHARNERWIGAGKDPNVEWMALVRAGKAFD